MSAKAIMIQGTGSGVGKSVIAAAICRIFLQDGLRVAPFKAQNMALNSFVTLGGGEMGRAQVMQAEACRIEPRVEMNPILLKPMTNVGAQVILMGKPLKNMDVEEYIEFKRSAGKLVKRAYDSLAREFDIVVIEGAGSPAEINLQRHDIVNMEMAHHANAPVVLVGDIDKGGVFASFIGTLELIPNKYKKYLKAFLINKFRGRKALLDPGLKFLQRRTHRSVLGVVPYFNDIRLPDEDSLSLASRTAIKKRPKKNGIKIAVLYLPHISNFTDFDPLEIERDVSLAYVRLGEDLDEPDVLIIPGTKNTLSDLKEMKVSGMDEKILDLAKAGKTVIGICGGYQMLGKEIVDKGHVESDEPHTKGLGLLDIRTEFQPEKTLMRVEAYHPESGLTIRGYEIHMGQSRRKNSLRSVFETDGAQNKSGNVWGTYIHGLFDDDKFRRYFINKLRIQKKLRPLHHVGVSFDKDKEYDKLADLVRRSIDVKAIYELIHSAACGV